MRHTIAFAAYMTLFVLTLAAADLSRAFLLPLGITSICFLTLSAMERPKVESRKTAASLLTTVSILLMTADVYIGGKTGQALEGAGMILLALTIFLFGDEIIKLIAGWYHDAGRN